MKNTNERSRRRYLRLSLRSLLVLVVAICVGFSWLANRAQVQREAVAAIERVGGKAWYDWEWKNGLPVPNGTPWWPKWLVDLIGIDYFGNVVAVSARRASDAELAHIGSLSRLEVLLLTRSSLTDAGLAHLERLGRIRALSLQHTSVTDAGLAHLRRLANLQELGLGDTAISDAGLPLLAELTQLRELGVENTKVTNAGMSRLQRALPKARIRP